MEETHPETIQPNTSSFALWIDRSVFTVSSIKIQRNVNIVRIEIYKRYKKIVLSHGLTTRTNNFIAVITGIIKTTTPLTQILTDISH